ncbi:M48 family metalloprotease [Candidatus Poribacteria bacterium]|nr:M48 family metalloprotease [Candidatus Poribacteria bacterium]
MRNVSLTVVITLLIFIYGGCAINPITGKKEVMIFSDKQEVALGKNSDPDIRWQFGGTYDDPEIQRYVEKIGQSVAAVSHRSDIPYHFTVVDDSVVNAFALPGGYIYISRGLLAHLDNEAQLSAILGHETGHVAARHGMKRLQSILGFNVLLGIVDQVASGSEDYRRWRGLIKTTSQVAFTMVIQGYSRGDELESDELGALYASKAGYDPDGMMQTLEILGSLHNGEPSAIEELFRSHPKDSKRIENVKDYIKEMPPERQNGILNKSEFALAVKDLKLAQEAYNHYDKAEFHRREGRYQEALDEYNKALQMRNLAKPHHGIGLVYEAQGNYDSAIREYETVLQIDPNYIFSLNAIGRSYIKLKRYNDALPKLKKAVEIYENFDDAYANMGEAYYNLNKYSESVEPLEMALALNENHPRAHTTLGLTYEALGEKEKAIAEYEKAVAVAPQNDYTNIAKDRLEKLK